MRLNISVLVLLLIPAFVRSDAPVKTVSPAEAAKKVNEKVVVEMEVKSTGGEGVAFLNSEMDYKDAKNFTIFLPKETVEKFKAAKVDNIGAHFKGKTIRVTGTVILYRDRPEIKVDDPDQIKIIDKK
jgi:DNA/RNA endonuclease YhcR with UshA esterase domain